MEGGARGGAHLASFTKGGMGPHRSPVIAPTPSNMGCVTPLVVSMRFSKELGAAPGSPLKGTCTHA